MLIDPRHLAQLLATADPKAPVTLAATAPAETWRRLLALETEPAENLSTKKCAERYGWTDKDWRRWAKNLPGAVLQENGRWMIPATAAKAEADRRMKRGDVTGGPQAAGAPRRSGNAGKYWSLKQGHSQSIDPEV